MNNEALTPDQVLALNSPVSPAAGGNPANVQAQAEAPAGATSNGPGPLAHVASSTTGAVIAWFVLVAIALVLGGIAKGG